MKDVNEISQFFQYFFKELNKQKVTYCVLRNYEDLPYSFGRDVDMWVKKEDQIKIKKIISNIPNILNWDVIQDKSEHHIKEGSGAFIFSKSSSNELEVIRLEYSFHLYDWRGVACIDGKIVSRHIIMNERGFFIPSPGLEVAVTLLKEIILSKKIKEKYKKGIVYLLEKEPDVFIKIIKKSFGKKTALIIYEMVRKENWRFLEKHSTIFRLIITLKSLINRPFYQIKKFLAFIYNKVITRIFNSSNLSLGFFIVLIGPDGSGKTTVSRKLIESQSIKRIFPGQKYYYRNFGIFPEIKKISKKVVGHTPKNIVYSKDSNFKFSFFRSVVYIVYYGFEYFFARILVKREKKKGTLIVFDRYFYEYFLQRAYNKCPRWIISFFEKIIVKPDLIVFLKNDSKVIYARKKDISLNEIENQNNLCQKIIDRNPGRGLIIETNMDADAVAVEIQKSILSILKQRLSPNK